MKRWLVIFVYCVAIPALSAESTEKNEATTVIRDSSLRLTITGNKELPNVLYIVPWKKGPANDVSPIQGRIVDEVYGPVENNVFKRRVNLFRQLNPVADSEADSEK